MLYMILTIMCSSGMSLSIKLADRPGRNMRVVTVINYLMTVLLCYAFLDDKTIVPTSMEQWKVLLLSTLNGCLFLSTLLLLQMNIRKNGATISSSIGHLGVLVPTVLSTFLFGEYPEGTQWIGVLIALVAVFALNYDGRGAYHNVGSKFGLIVLLLSGGFADMMSKVFEVYGEHRYEGHFLFYTFAVSLVISIIWAIASKSKANGKDIIWGTMMGSFNYLSTMFLLKAILQLPAYIVYPIYSVGFILVVNIVNFLFLKEELSKKDYVAMGLVCVALVFLNI